MKDTDTLILKAFIVSLYQLQSPLPQEFMVQLKDIAQSLEAKIPELDELAMNTPILADYYDNAYSQLIDSAAERGMGIKHLKYWSDSDPQNSGSSTEGDNVTPDAQEAIEILKQAIKQNQKQNDNSDNPTT